MSLTVIIVVYNCVIENSKTYISLLKNYMRDSQSFEKINFIVYDNSPSIQSLDFTVFKCEYVHDNTNKGLAVAYNYALSKAVNAFCDWLLLLDQDSSLPDDFIVSLMDNLSKVGDNDEIAAVVPKMCFKNNIFSPTRIWFGGIVRAIDRRHRGICMFKNACAIGSGSTVRVPVLQKIGGFNEVFWMDCLDRWMFYSINKIGNKIYVMDSIVEHELSVRNYDKFMNEKRYLNILKAETLFMKSYGSKMENFIFYIRLIKRAVCQFYTVSDKKYSLMTLRHLKDIVFSANRP
ncbi:MAG: glycosyltransferase [Pseudomonadota bacterium]